MKNNKVLIYSLLLLTILAFGGITYAFFSANVSGDEGSSIIIKTGTLRLVYTDTEYINVSDLLPGESVSKTITVYNEGNVSVNYDLVWIELLNEFITKSDLVMSITCNSDTDTCEGYNENIVSISGEDIPIIYNIPIDGLETHTYNILITFKETGINQDDNQGKIIHGKIGIVETPTRLVNINGIAYDNNDIPLANTTIVLHSDPISTMTDDDGYFVLANVPLGEHTIILKNGDTIIKEDTVKLDLKDKKEIDDRDIKLNTINNTQTIKINTTDTKLVYDFMDLEYTPKYCFMVSAEGTIDGYYDWYYFDDDGSVYSTTNYVTSLWEIYGGTVGMKDNPYIPTLLNNNIKQLVNDTQPAYLNPPDDPKYQICPRDIKIPNVVNDIPIYEILDNAFFNSGITSVTIPNDIMTIGYNAFANNQLTTLNIPNSVEIISESAFENNKITNINIGTNVYLIDAYAFSNNKITTLNIPSNVEAIEFYAFTNNELTNLTINNGISSIGAFAFAYNNLKTITIPSSITTIGNNAFSFNNMLYNIVNQTNKSFNWGTIVGSTNSYNFITGNIGDLNTNNDYYIPVTISPVSYNINLQLNKIMRDSNYVNIYALKLLNNDMTLEYYDNTWIVDQDKYIEADYCGNLLYRIKYNDEVILKNYLGMNCQG